MIEPFPTTKAQDEYDGPAELRPFADFLPYLGELAISFSRLERRVTWAIESILGTTRDEAHGMEDLVQNFSSRIAFLEVTGRPVGRETDTEAELNDILAKVRAANAFRNKALHNSFTGISFAVENGTVSEPSVMKDKFNKKPEKRSYKISTVEFRTAVIDNFSCCRDIQRWVLSVRPQAENREP